MRNFKTILTGTGLSALVMVMNGCDSGERIQAPSISNPTLGAVSTSDSSEFDRELITAKTAYADPSRREQAIMAILDKYGVEYPRADAPMDPYAVGPALAKAAASAASSFDPLVRSFNASGDLATHVRNYLVQNGQSIGVAAIGNSAGVDPILVGYQLTRIPGLTTNTLKVVAFNDDIGSANRNSVISFTNNTGSEGTYYIAAFAYSAANRGLGLISINGTAIPNQPIGGSVQYAASPIPVVPSNCNPQVTRLFLQGISGNLVGANALVIDVQNMRGGTLMANSTTKKNFELPWLLNNFYPNFALVYSNGGVTNATWQFTQRDHYNCVQ